MLSSAVTCFNAFISVETSHFSCVCLLYNRTFFPNVQQVSVMDFLVRLSVKPCNLSQLCREKSSKLCRISSEKLVPSSRCVSKITSQVCALDVDICNSRVLSCNLAEHTSVFQQINCLIYCE